MKKKVAKKKVAKKVAKKVTKKAAIDPMFLDRIIEASYINTFGRNSRSWMK